MNDQHIIMLENFPLLIPSKDFKSWKGHLFLNMHSICIEVSCPNIPQLENLDVSIPDYEFFNFYQFNLKETVEKIKEKVHSLPEFLNDLTSVLNQVSSHDIFPSLQNINDIVCINNTFYAVIREVSQCDQYVYKIEENLKHITFNVIDVCMRNHFLTIYIPDEYPIAKQQLLNFETMIPSVSMNSLLKLKTILKLFRKFKRIVNELSDFWNVHEEIVNTCNVIGSYTFKDNTYRMPIDNHVLVKVEVDPFNPKSCPKFELQGQSKFIEKFQLRLNEIDPILIWSSDKNFKENILDVFGVITLDCQYEEDKKENTIELQNNLDSCFICYDELDATLKKQTKMCVNEKCDALYHMACICEWMLNSGSTPMFEHLQGKCPQCDEDMLVALENFDLIKK